jgi:DNA-binding IscR family transcriptional regulator
MPFLIPMLKLSARSEYGLLLVKFLLDHPGIVPLKKISNALHIPEPILRKVSQQLVSQGICISQK